MVIPFTTCDPENVSYQTLIYVRRGEQVLLGLKLRGFLNGTLNGYGGKVEHEETVDDCAVRELYEESTLVIEKSDLQYQGFVMFSTPSGSRKVFMYSVTHFSGEPQTTDEMEPYWYNVNDIPYDKMKSDHVYWFPYILGGNVIEGLIVTDANENIEHQEIVVL